MTTSTSTTDYISRKGLCEICGVLTNHLAWNRTFAEWDFVCRSCQEALGIFGSDWESSGYEYEWDY